MPGSTLVLDIMINVGATMLWEPSIEDNNYVHMAISIAKNMLARGKVILGAERLANSTKAV